MFVIQFKPYGARPFIHRLVDELNDKVVAGEDIFGKSILGFRDLLLKAGTAEEKFQIAENWLDQVYDEHLAPPKDLQEVVTRLQREAASNYQSIVGEYPKTHKHLIDQFKKYVGLTPKYYQRVLRFNEILQLINQSKKIEWSQIAYQCEYADQSHFIKEFKHFSGINPQEFITNEFHRDGDNFFPLDRKG